MLVAIDVADSRIVAWDAVRGVAYRCPVCREAVRLKQGSRVIHHFAHQRGSACANAGETRQHLEMKSTLYQAMRGSGASCECDLEYPIGERRADVWLRTGAGRQIAIECQHSPIPAIEVAAKVAAYTLCGVDVLYVVHAEAFPDYRRAVGITSLHKREIRVPEWVREVTTPDPATLREYAALDDGPFVPYGREFVHVWDSGRLWILELTAIYREKFWGRNSDIVVLGTKREARLLGAVHELNGPWSFAAGPGPVSYAVVPQLAALTDPHPSVLIALSEAPRVPSASTQRSRRVETRGCEPSPKRVPTPVPPPLATHHLTPTEPVSAEAAPSDPQLQLGLALPQAPKPTRRVPYD